MMKKYHFVYQIENLINGKIYVGKHSTNDPNDSYMSSGPKLLQAIKKYGKENFKKTILKFFNTEQEALEFESKIVTEEFVLNRNTYNVSIGGTGSFPWYDTGYKEKMRKIASEVCKKNIAEGKMKPFNWSGRKHRNETKEKMSKIARENGHQKGEKNSQYGTMWITNSQNTDSIRIHKSELDAWILKGWHPGRKMKSGICYGEKNFGYQKIWIHNLEQKKSIRIKKDELDLWLSKGWLKGRKIKFPSNVEHTSIENIN